MENTLKNLDRLRNEINNEMLEIAKTVSSELAKMGRHDLNTLLARYTQLSGQDIDLVYEYHDVYFGRTLRE